MSTENYIKKNNKDWQTIHTDIFGSIVPSHCEWENIDDIVSILNKIAQFSNSNHMFYPDGGGLDLLGAKKSHEKRCIELLTGVSYVIKPRVLQFESIDNQYEWNYFRIETEILKPSGIYGSLPSNAYMEEVCELDPLNYVNRSHLDADEYHGEKLPATARPLVRYFKGSLVIFKKSSIYNNTSSTYDGRHEAMGAEGFKIHILEAYRQLNGISEYA